MPERSEMDQWLIKLDPNMATVFDTTYKVLEAEKQAMPGMKGMVDAEEQKLILKAKELAQGQGAAHPAAANGSAAKGAPPAAPEKAEPEGEKNKLPVKGAIDISGDIGPISKELSYAKLTLTASTKFSVENANGGETAAGGGLSTGAETKVAMGASVGLGDFELFHGLDVSGVSLNFQQSFGSESCEISFGVEGSLNFPAVKRNAKVSGELKLLEFVYKSGDLKALTASLQVAPFPFETVIKGMKASGQCSLKVTVEPDKKKIMAAFGKKILLEVAEKLAKDEAEKQGAKMVTAEICGQVVSKLGPVMTAFSVGLTVGELLTKFTHAGDTAEAVDGAVLDGYRDRFQKSGTAGKVAWSAAYAPLIASTVVVSGVVGTVEGIGELGAKGYHAIKDRVSGVEVDQEALKAAQKTMEEEADKQMAEETESDLYGPHGTSAHEDPPPPPPPPAAAPKKAGR